MRKLKVKKGATVQVIAGSDKGKTGSVLDIRLKDMKVRVQGVRMQTKVDKKENVLIKTEGYIDYSNVKPMEAKKAAKKTAKKTAKKDAATK